ncbi:PIR Superfamily Protein [Plasmodium ovale wallikeri]|uniref:PIR Superfamily Protein n=1 Tax=Plasmodium ovale wallikeri TaxID=864142 RepID=A0A1A9AR17_PLAOA|nr:PIR Superfamily Protein [Plasmodium ovale wallikeri]
MDELKRIEELGNLVGLPSHNAYTELDKINDSYKRKYLCEPTNYLGSRFNGYKDICESLAKGLKYIYDKSSQTEEKNKLCRYLSFWIHDKVLNHGYDKMKGPYHWYIWHIIRAWEYINFKLVKSADYKCNHLFHDINMEDTKKRKILYDYCENHDEMSKILFRQNKECTKYYDYLKKLIKLHGDFNSIWSIEEGRLPSYIVHCENEDPSGMVTAPKCVEIENSRETDELNDGQEYKIEVSLGDEVQSSGSTGNSPNVFFILLPFFGILFSFFFSYKYTSFGSRLRSFLLSNKLIRSTIDRKEVEKYTTPSNEHINENLYENFLNVGYTSI